MSGEWDGWGVRVCVCDSANSRHWGGRTYDDESEYMWGSGEGVN